MKLRIYIAMESGDGRPKRSRKRKHPFTGGKENMTHFLAGAYMNGNIIVLILNQSY